MNEFKTMSPRALNDIIELGEHVHLIDVSTPAASEMLPEMIARCTTLIRR